MEQKPNNEELKAIDLLYKIIQPTKAMVYDHEDEIENYQCDQCNRRIRSKKGLCSSCFESYMM